MSEPEIKISYGDWLQEYMLAEPDVTSDEAIFARLQEGKSTAEVARWTIVARERQEAPEDILKPNKLLLHAAAAEEISDKVVGRYERIQLEDGREIEVRSYVAPVVSRPKGEAGAATYETEVEALESDGQMLVRWNTQKAVERAFRYLERVVPGHICGRLKLIAANQGDVREAAERLKQTIDEMVDQLIEPLSL